MLQLELIGHDFFVFRSGESNEMNIVYRRRDGELRADRAAVIFRREPLHKKLAREARLEQDRSRRRSSTRAALGDDRDPRRPAARGAGTRSPRPKARASRATRCTSSRSRTATSWSTRTSRRTRSHRSPMRSSRRSSRRTVPRPSARATTSGPSPPAASRSPSFEADGDELELVAADEGRTLTVDGERAVRQRPRARAHRREPGRRVRRPRQTPGRRPWEVTASPL